FPDARGEWRYPVTPDQVSPRYLQALLGYEDQWFYWHPGVNPWALLRAAWQWWANGEIVCGCSTQTLEGPTILGRHDQSIAGKLKQIFRALQLEWHYSKREILTLYLNLAPFGGPIEGVAAAARAYLGKAPAELSHAEAALLVVLPQAPTRLRPDLHPRRATAARNKVLTRMLDCGIWPAAVVAAARAEHVTPRFAPQPLRAPLLAQRLSHRARAQGRVVTTIDAGLQARVEALIANRIQALPPATSAAVLVVENDKLAVRAYLGSADFANDERFGYVDMVTAPRSPGSTLKPFLYGLALEDGLIHSASLLVDAPRSFGGYAPANFSGGFTGPVTAAVALQRSLNVPAVALLDRVGPRRFAARLRQGGMTLAIPGGPNLAMILGGLATSLADLVGAYRALAHGGLAGQLRLTPDAPLRERRLLSPGAAWIVRKILASAPRPGMARGPLATGDGRRVAFKTGTSYGYRDTWAVGVTSRYTVGVWFGRPDGTPIPGHFGAITALPVLFEIVGGLAERGAPASPAPPPSVTKTRICWPLGTRRGIDPQSPDAHLCRKHLDAWILNDTIPPTMTPVRATNLIARYWVNPASGLRVAAGCGPAMRVQRATAGWPLAIEPWLAPPELAAARPPPWHPDCQDHRRHAALQITGLPPASVITRPPGATAPPVVTLAIRGGHGALYWLVDHRVAQVSPPQAAFRHRLAAGEHAVTVLDTAGNWDRVRVKVLE
ncbi:MAG: penicillin-binding protein 1C, partial [Salinisphaera sp.]|nr:penicillin-binding protein 1C [Salinisphaera sp.]